ncbi:MAG: DNA polymerase III subunit alpha [Pseudomonadota bacterium]
MAVRSQDAIAGDLQPGSEHGGFVHLHVHTQYSIVDGLLRVPELMARARDTGMPAVALTDAGNLFAMVKFYTKAVKAGVKPLIGVELAVHEDEQRQHADSMLLLCQNLAGYRNLTKLVTRAYLEGQHQGRPGVDWAWLDRDATQGLIALSGGFAGDVARLCASGNTDTALARAEHWQDVFGDRYYLQVSRTGRAGENRWIQHAVHIGNRLQMPLVATNDVRFLSAGDFDAHEARVCIHQGRTLADNSRPRHYSNQQYLRSAEEMRALFHDMPGALDNSVAIAARCSLDLELGKSYLPEFPVPDGSSAGDWLRKQSQEGLARKKAQGANYDSEQETYEARLQRELDTICDMGFPGYFLIVADFIRWARENGVPVGPGRGSGAGSLVAFVLGITDIDPLEHDLLFERFLNPERVSMPDFDVDFCMEGRDKVIGYVADHYGRHRVSQIITYGTMAAKAVVRDAGRVLEFPYGFVDRIAKLIPFEVGMTLEKALDAEPELARLRDEDDEVRSILDLALSLEGCVRNAGKHAGGVVIAPTELTDFTPLYCEQGGGNLVTQFDKDDVESAGLVKFDFLGLRTLTIIDRALASVNDTRARNGEPAIDLKAMPMDDPQTFKLLQRCHTTAVFQLESRGMKDLINRLRPDSFGDLVALVALFRPGPLQSGMVDDFIARKHAQGSEVIDYLHPDLKPVLESTYGVILYQEQVMQIAQVLAGYTLGGADLLRRAMGKKKPEEMAKQRVIFVEGCVERDVDRSQAEYIFDLMEKFAGYGFNKSHSAAYAVLSYHTAWLKAHYPAQFMAAVMSSDMDSTDKLVGLKDDCRLLDLTLLGPDVNASVWQFSATDAGDIRYGMGAVKGVGHAAVEAIVEAREQGGAFASLADLCARVDTDRINRRMLESLIKSGAADCLHDNRRSMFETLPELVKRAEQDARARAAGQDDLFGSLSVPDPIAETITLREVAEWNHGDRLSAEKEALGLYLSGHPFQIFRDIAAQLTHGKIGDIISIKPPAGAQTGNDFSQPRRQVTVAGLIFDIRRRGNRVTLTLDDDTGRIDIQLYADMVDAVRHLLVKDSVVMASGALRWDSFMNAWAVSAKQLREFDHVIEEQASSLVIAIARPADDAEATLQMRELQTMLRPHRGGNCEVHVHYRVDDAVARVSFGPLWRIRMNRSLRDELANLFGDAAIRIGFSANASALRT